MSIQSYNYFGAEEHYCGEVEIEWDDPNDPILTCIRREYCFKIDSYVISIASIGLDCFEYSVVNNNQTIFESKEYRGHPTYENVTNMLLYYQKMVKRQDVSSEIQKMYQPHADAINGKNPQTFREFFMSITWDDLKEACDALAEEMGISPDTLDSSENKD